MDSPLADGRTANFKFSPDEQTVSVANEQRTLTMKRPVVSAWDFKAKGTTYDLALI
jgi:hypothetical protein